ncbi:G-type lectin S-receptor-like serine/threonine-protein kinase [Vitis vinifera]|uniref:G-type lectin S-receptor-like serine/threonine-protein kinase n=1 Tax=Vitis vinifera TaxID=29760 RepID=A0A438HS93_VITVI|nr:G-type lectin S-receptor-like serine/threonine-protein kinase [Vitis vinifera]
MCLFGGPCFCRHTETASNLGKGFNSRSYWFRHKGLSPLGFFSLDTRSYLGIWYTSDVDNKKVWVANRDNPISGTNANLMLDGNGTLMIIHSGDGSAKQTLWESFDDPTDTLLPGMKLGINLKTRQNWSLASWINEQVPDPGTFTLEWNGTQLTYFSYSVQDGAISKWVLNWRGGFFDTYGTLFVKEDMCDRYGKYPGCAVQEPPTCRTRDFQFMKQSVLNSGYPSLMNIDTSLGLSDCQAICRNNCSCTACNTVFTNGTGCQFWRDNCHEPEWVMQIRRSSMSCPHQKIQVRLSMYCIPKEPKQSSGDHLQEYKHYLWGGDRELEKPEQIVPSDSEVENLKKKYEEFEDKLWRNTSNSFCDLSLYNE